MKLYKKRLQHRFFPVNFVNCSKTPILQRIYEPLLLKHQYPFLKTPFFTENLQGLLLTVSGFQPVTLLKTRVRQRCVNFAKFLRTSFDRALLDDCLQCLSLNFESTSGKLLISSTSCQISTTAYRKNLFHKCFSSILHKKKKKQLFKDVHVLKIRENYL